MKEKKDNELLDDDQCRVQSVSEKNPITSLFLPFFSFRKMGKKYERMKHQSAMN